MRFRSSWSNLETSDLAHELDINAHYRQLFNQIRDDKLRDLHVYAAVICFERGSWGGRLRPEFSTFETTLADQATLDLLFPRHGNNGASH